MGTAPGLASHERKPEVAGIFLCRDLSEARWFAKFGQSRFPVDIWAVRAESLDVAESEDGFLLSRSRIPPERLELLETVD
jgi:hypothetical protein